MCQLFAVIRLTTLGGLQLISTVDRERGFDDGDMNRGRIC